MAATPLRMPEAAGIIIRAKADAMKPAIRQIVSWGGHYTAAGSIIGAIVDMIKPENEVQSETQTMPVGSASPGISETPVLASEHPPGLMKVAPNSFLSPSPPPPLIPAAPIVLTVLRPPLTDILRCMISQSPVRPPTLDMRNMTMYGSTFMPPRLDSSTLSTLWRGVRFGVSKALIPEYVLKIQQSDPIRCWREIPEAHCARREW